MSKSTTGTRRTLSDGQPSRTSSERLNADGWEVLDTTPLSLPSGFKRPETLAEQVQRLVRGSISRYAEASGAETWEEANDFELDEDFDPTTPYEEFFDPVIGRNVTPDEFRRHEDRYREEVLLRQKNYYRMREQEQFQEELEKPKSRKKREAAEGAAPAPAKPERSGTKPGGSENNP